jgi:hypothetical protein
MKVIYMTMALALPIGGAAAQSYDTHNNIYGQPRYGSTTTGPDGDYKSNSIIFGQPKYGTETRTPDGRRCVTKDIIFGQPSYGQRTECN